MNALMALSSARRVGVNRSLREMLIGIRVTPPVTLSKVEDEEAECWTKDISI